MQLFKCDKCGKTMGEDIAQRAIIAYYRTKEEIEQLAQSEEYLGMPIPMIIEKSKVVRKFDLCKDCYEAFKQDYFAIPE